MDATTNTPVETAEIAREDQIVIEKVELDTLVDLAKNRVNVC
jgi:hypothetical protein